MCCGISSFPWWRPLASHSSLLVCLRIYHTTHFSCQVEFLWVSSVGERSGLVSQMREVLC